MAYIFRNLKIVSGNNIKIQHLNTSSSRFQIFQTNGNLQTIWNFENIILKRFDKDCKN